MFVIEQNEIVKVAADHPRGLDRSEDLEVAALGRAREMPREQAKLNRAGGIQLAVQPSFHFTLVLQLGREPAPPFLCDAQVLRQHDAEHERRRQCGIDAVEQELRKFETRESRDEEDRDEAKQRGASYSRTLVRQRKDDDESRDQHDRDLDQVHRRRTAQQISGQHRLERLVPRPRPLPSGQAESDPGSSSREQLSPRSTAAPFGTEPDRRIH